jgi:hypothetical protein
MTTAIQRFRERMAAWDRRAEAVRDERLAAEKAARAREPLQSWRPVVGFEDSYEVSDLGNLRSALTGKSLHPYTTDRGYLRVDLQAHGEKRKAFVHDLVLEAFVGPCPAGQQGRHVLDPTPSNCALENLAWGTPKQNYEDRRVHGTALVPEDLTDMRFGRLRVTGLATASSKHRYWRCRCSCGGEHVVRGELLRAGRVTSCRACRGGVPGGASSPPSL